MSTTCTHRVPEQHMSRYWLDDLDGADADALEEHAFGCAECSARLGRWASLILGMRDVVRAAPPPVMTLAQLEQLRARDVRLLEIHAQAFGELRAPVPDDVDACVVHIAAELAGVDHVDLMLCHADGSAFAVLENIPFEAAAGEVIVACSRDIASAHAELVFVLRGHAGATSSRIAECRLICRP